MKRLTLLALTLLLSACSSAPKTAPPAGSSDDRSIGEQMTAHRNDLRSCYEKAPESKKTRGGDLKVAFVVNSAGRVTSAKIEQSTLGLPQVEDCVLGVIRAIQFDPLKSAETAEVTFPIRFKKK